MPVYTVTVTALVIVTEEYTIEARTQEEAEEIAEENLGNAYPDLSEITETTSEKHEPDPDALREAHEADRDYHAKWGI
jgi:hypothetical protein